MSHTFSIKQTLTATVITFMGLILATAPVFAADATTTAAMPVKKPTVDLVCMQTAVGVREDAIAAALSTRDASIQAAFAARKTAVVAAWGLTDKAARKAAIKVAWSTWKKSVRDARTAAEKARKAAWTTYRASVKNTCHGVVSPDDSSTLEATI